jgi:hypothetical protein
MIDPMNSLRAVFLIQLILMTPAFLFFLATPANVYTLLLLSGLIPAAIVTTLTALWHAARHPDRRPLAAAIICMAVVCLGLPFLLQGIGGGPVPVPWLITLGAAAAFIAAVVLMGRAPRWGRQQSTATRSGCRLLASMASVLGLLWTPALGWLSNSALRERLAEVDADTALTLALAYYLPLSIAAAALTFFGLANAVAGLIRSPPDRLLHSGQLLAGLLLLATLCALTFVAMIGMTNPG